MLDDRHRFPTLFRRKIVFPEIRGATCHPRSRSNPGNFVQHLYSRDATSHDNDMFSGKLPGIFVFTRVQLSAVKLFPARIFGTTRGFPRTGGVDDTQAAKLWPVCPDQKPPAPFYYFVNPDGSYDR